ncbi:adenine phosphoribosyltransferase [Cloeon dipterum]
MSSDKEDIEFLKGCLKSYPDFPKKGILFQDIFSLLSQPEAFGKLKKLLVSRAKTVAPQIDVVVGLDSRGFLFGPIIALELGIPFLPVRKKGKLPGKIFTESYQLEYGEDILEMQDGVIKEGQKALIVDDLIATGGTLEAACKLVQRAGGSVSCCLVVIELTELRGREKLVAPVEFLMQY